MTNLIDREGRFRGTPLQGVIKPTKNGFPQFVVELLATEYYDADGEFGEAGEWVDWSEYGETRRAYLCLFNADKALLNYEQVMKAFNWDGSDFGALQRENFDGLVIQFEIESSEWPVGSGTMNLKVNWVDAHDANPVSTLTPMDTNKLKQMTAQFGKFMTTGKKATPAKAPAKGKAKAPAKSKAKAPAAPKAAAPAPVEEETSALPISIDKGTAWEYLFSVKGEIEDDALAEAWVTGCEVVGGDREEDEFTDEDWASVRDHVLTELEITPN